MLVATCLVYEYTSHNITLIWPFSFINGQMLREYQDVGVGRFPVGPHQDVGGGGDSSGVHLGFCFGLKRRVLDVFHIFYRNVV